MHSPRSTLRGAGRESSNPGSRPVHFLLGRLGFYVPFARPGAIMPGNSNPAPLLRCRCPPPNTFGCIKLRLRGGNGARCLWRRKGFAKTSSSVARARTLEQPPRTLPYHRELDVHRSPTEPRLGFRRRRREHWLSMRITTHLHSNLGDTLQKTELLSSDSHNLVDAPSRIVWVNVSSQLHR